MPPKPLILAFDTSAAHCAAALLLGDTILSERLEPMHKGQAERLFPLLEELLAENGKGWADLDAISVCVGPGNFTGVRIAVSSARGLALSLNIPAVGISKLEAMAYDTNGHVTSALDARRDQVYLQSFKDGQAISEPQMASISEVPHQKTAIRTMSDEILDIAGAQGVDNIVSAIAHIAATRFNQESPRPAPLYLRPADAALPKDPPVVILP